MDANTRANLTDDILNLLIAAAGKESVSFLLSSLRQGDTESGRYWRGFSNLGDFETLCEDLGFTVYRSRNERGNPGLFVSLGEEIHPASKPAPAEGFVIFAAVERQRGIKTASLISRFNSYHNQYTTDLGDAKVYKTRRGAEKAAAKLARSENVPAEYVVTIADYLAQYPAK